VTGNTTFVLRLQEMLGYSIHPCIWGAGQGEGGEPLQQDLGLLQAGKHVLVSTFEDAKLCVLARKRDMQIRQLLLCMLKSSLEIQNAKDNF
jgi:hypothetical protein